MLLSFAGGRVAFSYSGTASKQQVETRAAAPGCRFSSTFQFCAGERASILN
jgi:hypothetical protein